MLLPLGFANKGDEPEKALVAYRAPADLVPDETKAVAGAKREAIMVIFIVSSLFLVDCE